MPELKKVWYTAVYKNNLYQVQCWKGTTLGQLWNELKQYYLPGSLVLLADDTGHSKVFIKGMC